MGKEGKMHSVCGQTDEGQKVSHMKIAMNSQTAKVKRPGETLLDFPAPTTWQMVDVLHQRPAIDFLLGKNKYAVHNTFHRIANSPSVIEMLQQRQKYFFHHARMPRF
jgi:hypothetical protein